MKWMNRLYWLHYLTYKLNIILASTAVLYPTNKSYAIIYGDKYRHNLSYITEINVDWEMYEVYDETAYAFI